MIAEFLTDLRDHWRDGYWWADHQWLTAILVGTISFLFTAARIWLERRMAP